MVWLWNVHQMYFLHVFITGSNACRANNGGCSSLCLATPTGRSCACAEDQLLDPADNISCKGNASIHYMHIYKLNNNALIQANCHNWSFNNLFFATDNYYI